MLFHHLHLESPTVPPIDIDTINDADEGIGAKRPAAVTERHTLVVAGGKELIELALEQLISTGQTKTSCHGEGNVLDAMTHRGRPLHSIHAALSCKTSKSYLSMLFHVFSLRSRNKVARNLRQQEENSTQQKNVILDIDQAPKS